MSDVAKRCADSTVMNLWHPVAAESEIGSHQLTTLLLGHPIVYGRTEQGRIFVGHADGDEAPLPVKLKFGYLWTSLGEPEEDLFEIAEADEPDRRVLNAGSIMVATSAPRAIENFLDMGHFPYVHTGALGIEPRTEVVDYETTIEDGEIWARDCKFYQPMAAASAEGGQVSNYIYRVPHPYCVMLYKTSPPDSSRMDVIGLFVQAMTDVSVRAHNFLCLLDDESSDTELRRFQQMIFSQDKPVLENQYPKRLPLDPRVEVPIRADKSAILYRRWLTDLGLTYSVVPA